jgi:hypothetical protein
MRVALVDGNNFYVCCERIFNPRLEGVPVVVMGNNDGIIVSRSNEAKALGILTRFLNDNDAEGVQILDPRLDPNATKLEKTRRDAPRGSGC